MAKLIILSDTGVPREVALSAVTRIGRHPSQDAQILDRLVSKEHATIEERSDGFWIVDLGSRNGTFVNNRLIDKESRLRNGDQITLGSTKVLFSEHGSEGTGMHRVTIGPDAISPRIHSKISASDSSDYLPENNVRDIEALRRDYERLRRAFRLHQEIALELNLDALLEKLLDHLFANLTVDRGVILLYDERTGEMEPRKVKTRDGSESTDEIAISKTILNQVASERTAVLSFDASVDSRFSGAQSIILQHIRSTMCVPLLARDKLLGAIHVDTRVETGAFTDKDLGVLQGLASLAALWVENTFLVKRSEEEAVTRQQFERLLSPNLVEQVVNGEIEIRKGGEQRLVTVLFADIRGFTRMSEDQPAHEIVHMLNEYFEMMVDVVFRYEGTLDKFIGDEIMAIWGAPVSHDNDPEMAVRAALQMQAALKEFNELRRTEGLRPIQIGIGLATGNIVAGYMGSTRTMSFTVIGRSVNLAARLCSAAEAGQILVSEELLECVRDLVTFEAQPSMALKGISRPVVPYSVTGLLPGIEQGVVRRDGTVTTTRIPQS